MADLIVGQPGDQTNIGDPENCDEKYRSGMASISEDARNELSKYPELVIRDLLNRAGPQTRAYLSALHRLANTRFVYGRWPQMPPRIED